MAESASFAAAARQSHTVPSNVTAHINKKLEQELSARLLAREHGVQLTPAGTLLRRHARNLLARHDDAVAALTRGDAPAGTLRIGAPETTPAVRLPDLFGGYHHSYPAVDLELTPGPSADLTTRRLAGTLDCAFIAGLSPHCALHCLAAFAETLVLVSDRPMAAIPTPETLAMRPFLAFAQG